MSGNSAAVFLSYASQDAEAARRIAEALRQAGVEVWFDQSELVGGDQWDGKIRGQISSCALFVPVISANTQARLEGYFRLEWKLAAQRTHTMADERTFLLPVVIDLTRDGEAKVPAEFKAVQWTKLPGGETPAAFGERVKRLLDGDVGRDRLIPPRDATAGSGDPARQRRPRRWLAPVLAGAVVALLALVISRPWEKTGTGGTGGSPPAATPPVAPLSEARKLAAQAQALIDDPNFTRENYRLADELCQRALALDASDAEVWAVAAFVSEDMITESYDDSAQRQSLARTQSERAVRLDPQSVHAGLAAAKNLRLSGDLTEAIRRLRELMRRAPADRLVLRELARSERKNGNDAGVQEVLARLQALPGGDPRTLATEAKDLRNLGRLVEAEALDDQLLATTPVRLAYYEKLLVLARGWSDLAAATTFIGKIPAELQHEDAFGAMIAQIWLWQGKGDKALEALGRVPHDLLEEFAARGPKAYMAGWAQSVAGRPAAAQAEWQSALDLTETRLTADRNNLELLAMKAALEALLGKKEAARATWRLRVELGGTTDPADLLDAVGLPILLGDSEEAISVLVRRWAAMGAGRRDWYFSNLRYAPEFAPIRDDPRVQQIIAEQIATLAALRRPPGVAPPAAIKVDEKSVAVLAFDNLSDDKGNEYFSDGMSEELLNVLAKVPGLKVAARTSAFYFKGKQVPIPEIARTLGVAYVVEGSVRKAGDRVRIAAQLIKAADGFEVWSDSFDRDLKNIFAVQDEIAGLIAQNISPKLGVTRSAVRPAIDPGAYQAYLTGRAEAESDSTASLKAAITHLEQAIAVEPGYTAAWVQLAHVYIQLARWGGLPAETGWAEARRAVDRAMALEPDSPDVLVALGWVRRTADWNWRGAEQAFRRALELRPDHPETMVAAAVLFFNVGREQESLRLARRAVELDPLNAATHVDLGILFLFSDHFPEAEQAFRRALELAPEGQRYHGYVAMSLIEQRRPDEAEEEARREPDETTRRAALGFIAIQRGDRAEALKQVQQIEAMSESVRNAADVDAYISGIYARLGDMDRAFAAQEHALATHDPSVAWLRSDVYLRELHGDPRWAALLHRVGLADDQLK